MRISQLQEILEKAIKEHGDIEVRVTESVIEVKQDRILKIGSHKYVAGRIIPAKEADICEYDTELGTYGLLIK